MIIQEIELFFFSTSDALIINKKIYGKLVSKFLNIFSNKIE